MSVLQGIREEVCALNEYHECTVQSYNLSQKRHRRYMNDQSYDLQGITQTHPKHVLYMQEDQYILSV